MRADVKVSEFRTACGTALVRLAYAAAELPRSAVGDIGAQAAHQKVEKQVDHITAALGLAGKTGKKTISLDLATFRLVMQDWPGVEVENEGEDT